MKKAILILGGGRLNIKTVEEAKKNNFYTIVVDANKDAPCFLVADEYFVADIRNEEDVLAKLGDIKIDGVVSMAEVGVYTGACISEKLNLYSISKEAAVKCTSKVSMRNSWKHLEYSLPFEVVTSIEDLNVACKKLNYMPLIVKPDKTYGGSRGVSKIHDLSQVEKAFLFAKESGLNENVVIENCTQGNEYSCEVLVYKDQISILAIGKKVKSKEPFRVDVSVQYPAQFTSFEFDKIHDMCQKCINAIGINNGVAHVEFAYTENGPKIFELAARCGGGHTPLIAKHVSGVNEFVEYCRISCGMVPENFKVKFQKGAEYKFLVFEEGVIENFEFQSIPQSDNLIDFVLIVSKGQKVKALQTTSDRLGCIVAVGNNLNEAKNIAQKISGGVKLFYTSGVVAYPLNYEDSNP